MHKGFRNDGKIHAEAYNVMTVSVGMRCGSLSVGNSPPTWEGGLIAKAWSAAYRRRKVGISGVCN